MLRIVLSVAGALFISGSAYAFDCMLPLLSPDARKTTTSAVCASCHSGQIEKAPLVDENHSHPADIPYGGAGEGFRTEEEIVAPVILVDGMVTCTSCHAPDSKELYRAALPPGRELCLACHVKE